jgi:hypothetical protein
MKEIKKRTVFYGMHGLMDGAPKQVLSRMVAVANGWLRRQGKRNLEEKDIFTDSEILVRSLCRPALNRLRDAVRSGEVSAVLVWRFDTLSTDWRHLAHLVEEFDIHGTDLCLLWPQIPKLLKAGLKAARNRQWVVAKI